MRLRLSKGHIQFSRDLFETLKTGREDIELIKRHYVYLGCENDVFAIFQDLLRFSQER